MNLIIYILEHTIKINIIFFCKIQTQIKLSALILYI